MDSGKIRHDPRAGIPIDYPHRAHRSKPLDSTQFGADLYLVSGTKYVVTQSPATVDSRARQQLSTAARNTTSDWSHDQCIGKAAVLIVRQVAPIWSVATKLLCYSVL